MNDELVRYSMLAILLLLIYFSYRVLEPFITYLFFSIIFVVVFKPVYEWLAEKTGKPRLSSFLLVLGLILLLVIPSFFAGYSLVRQAPAFYETALENIDFQEIESTIEQYTNQETNLREQVLASIPRFQGYLIEHAGVFFSRTTSVLIGLFIMFFVMYYLFTEKEAIMAELRAVTPLSKRHQDKLLKHINDVIHATINGQVILGVVQGVLGGVTMLLLGVPYAILWGFLMIITSTIPVLGSFAVWIPVAIWLYVTGAVTEAIILVVVGSAIIAQADNFLRPYVVSARADIHPATVIVGVFGGLYAFGLAGFIIGPLVLGLLLTVLRFYSEELAEVKA